MQRGEQYRTNAEEAERRARLAATEEERRAYRRIAEGWRDLQKEVEQAERRNA